MNRLNAGIPKTCLGNQSLLLISVALSFLLGSGTKPLYAASAESNNPFNEFMSPSGGVNLFSGDVAFSNPLYTLEGIGGLNVPLEMNYSGNVHLNVRANNEKAPTEWAGLGWRLGFGNIHCDHAGTGVLADDRYYYVSPKGVSQEILSKGGEYYLSKDPFWKVVPTISPDGMRILAWTLTDVNGKRFRYGDSDEVVRAQPSASRYVFWWKESTPYAVNFVGSGFSGTPKLYPVQWELAKEIDVDGNFIDYAYTQIRERVKRGTWTSPIEYTQAAYLASITLSGGGQILFHTKNKSADEFMDSHSASPEPDAFMEFFEKQYLESIQITNDEGNAIRTFRFEYVLKNFQGSLSSGYSKRFLTKIKELGGKGTLAGSHSFTYWMDDPENAENPLGVLTEMETPFCGKVKYDLKRVALVAPKKVYPTGTIGRFEKNAHAVGGKLKTGEEFLVVINGKGKDVSGNEIFIFNNEDGVWKQHFIKGLDKNPYIGMDGGRDVQVIPGEGFFVVVKNTILGCFFSFFTWDGAVWNAEDGRTKAREFFGTARVSAQRDMVVISITDRGESQVLSFHRRGNSWLENKVGDFPGLPGVTLNGEHLLLYMPKGWAYVFSWNGASWVKTLTELAANSGDRFVLGNGFLFAVRVNTDGMNSNFYVEYELIAYSWTGASWIKTTGDLLDTELFNASDDDAPDIQGVGRDYVLVRSDDQDHLHLFEFTGEKWRTSLNRNMVNSDWDWFEANWHGDAWNDYFVVRYPRISWHWKWYSIVPYKELDEDAKLVAFNRVGNSWKEKDFGALGAPNTSKRVVLGQDFFVHNHFPYNAQIWDGAIWNVSNKAPTFKENSLSMLSPTLAGEMVNGEISLFRKFQNSLIAPVYAYVVSTKSVYDPIRGQTSKYKYDYDLNTARFDIRAASAKFHKVTAHLPDHGSTISWFHNGEQDDTDPLSITKDSRDLAGNAYLEQDLDFSGKVVRENKRYFEVVRKEGVWPAEAKSVRISKVESINKNVRSQSEITYNEANGLPKLTVQTGSAGRKRIEESIFAFQLPAYSEMGLSGKHMMSQVAETHLYEGLANPSHLKSSRVSTWSKDAKGSWHAFQSWIWNGKPDGTETYIAFKHPIPSENAAPWKKQNIVAGRDAFGRITETTAANLSSSCFLYGREGRHVIADIANAKCGEIGVLPGDYDDAVSGFVDFRNGWAQNNTTLNRTIMRFGSAALHVASGGHGPSKRVNATAAGRDYLFSAWIYPISLSSNSPIALTVSGPSGEILSGEAVFADLKPGSTHGWQRVERKIPSGLLSGAFADVGTEARGGAEFLIQDIRFLPFKSQASVRFLDDRFFLPLASASPTGSAGYFEYDDLGRITKFYQEDGQGRKGLRSENEYHLGGCSLGQGLTGILAQLRVSAGWLSFSKTVHSYGDLWVDPLTDRTIIDFVPENPNEDVQIRIAGGDWLSPCCQGKNSQEIALPTASTAVEIRVGSGTTYGTPYTFTIKKPSTCWTPLGKTVSGGWASLPSAHQDGIKKYLAYSADQDGGKLYVKEWDGTGQAWKSMGEAISAGAAAEITLKVSEGVPYVAYLDEILTPQQTGDPKVVLKAVVKKWNGSSWMPLAGDGTVSLGMARSLAFDVKGAGLWVAYKGIKAVEEGVSLAESPIYVRKWDGAAWIPVGGGSPANGLVSDGDGEHVTLAIHPDGTPYVGYIGRVRIPAGIPDQTAGTFTSPFPIVKKLIHGSPVDYWGDLVAGQGSAYGMQGEVLNVPAVDRVQLAFAGTDLYLALAYAYLAPIPGRTGDFEQTGNRILDVRKLRTSETFVDKSHWFPLTAGTAPEDFAVTPLDAKGDFHFSAAGSVPNLVFVNEHNNHKITVLNFISGSWKAVGNPAFFASDMMGGPDRVSLSMSGTATPLVSARQLDESQESTRHNLRAMEYSGSCPDLTLAQLNVKDGAEPVSLDWKFRPFLLYLEGEIRSEATTVNLSVLPANLSLLSKVIVIAANGTAQEWTSVSGIPLPSSFSVPLSSGSNVIQVETVAGDGHSRLRYQVSLSRLPATALTGTVKLDGFVISPNFDIEKPGVYKILVPADKNSLQLILDISRNATVFVDGKVVDNRGEVVVILAAGTSVIHIVMVMEDGTRREFEIQVVRGTPSILLRPVLTSVLNNLDGTFTAHFGYENGNATERNIPVGGLNQIRYKGAQLLDMGQPTRFAPAVVANAFAVVFDGSPLNWDLDGSTVTATGSTGLVAFKVMMKDNGLAEANISKPQLLIFNASTSTFSGFKISLWLSREEVPSQEILADPYYFNPSGVTLAVHSHPDNENLIRVDLQYPPGFSMPPGASTDIDGAQLGIHFRNYYPGAWRRDNDWSWKGITAIYRETPYVTVYGSDGRLIAGQEPVVTGIPQPPALTQTAVFSMESLWTWQSPTIGLAQSTTLKTEGLGGLSAEGSGYFKVLSYPMKTTDIANETSKMHVDFYLPPDQPNPYWKGALQLVVNSSSAGLHELYVGQVELTPLASGAFSALEFTLPSNVVNILKGDYRDFQFQWVLNINQTTVKPVLDNMRFVP